MCRPRVILPFLLLLLLLLSLAAHAQETLVPIDEQGKLDRIDLRLERRIQLFPDYPDFREAQLFQLADSTFVLEVDHGAEGKLARNRIPMTIREVEILRQRVTAEVTAHAPQAVRDRSGRTKLLVGTTLLSLGFYGWALPVALDVSGGSEVGGLYLLTAGSTMILPIVLTKERDVSDAAATLGLYGAERGIVHGLLINALLADQDEEARRAVTLSWLVSMTEGVAGYAIADRSRLTKGQAEMIGAGGDVGMLLAAGAAVVTRAEDDGAAGTVLAGAGIGMLGGHALAADGRFTRGDSYLFRGAGTLGALVGVTAASAFDPDSHEERIYSACAMAGGVAGLAYGTGLARKTSLTGAEGVMVNVGMLGGGLLGLGVVVLGNPSTDSGFPYLIAASIGATAGFAVAYRFVTPGSEEIGSGPSWDMELAPWMAESAGAHGSAGRSRRSLGMALRLRGSF